MTNDDPFVAVTHDDTILVRTNGHELELSIAEGQSLKRRLDWALGLLTPFSPEGASNAVDDDPTETEAETEDKNQTNTEPPIGAVVIDRNCDYWQRAKDGMWFLLKQDGTTVTVVEPLRTDGWMPWLHLVQRQGPVVVQDLLGEHRGQQ